MNPRHAKRWRVARLPLPGSFVEKWWPEWATVGVVVSEEDVMRPFVGSIAFAFKDKWDPTWYPRYPFYIGSHLTPITTCLKREYVTLRSRKKVKG